MVGARQWEGDTPSIKGGRRRAADALVGALGGLA
jgi:hypothetical protein